MPKTLAPSLFASTPAASRRVLFLSKFLYSPDPQVNVANITFQHDDGKDFHAAHDILKKWAGMETQGLLKKKETALDANFLADVFGTALRYISVNNPAPDGSFTLDRQLAVPGVGPVDGALGFFPLKDPQAPNPVAVIELKGADTDLDTDKSNGRTAVRQLFDYLADLPQTNWGILSNFSTIRLYHKSRGTQTYEIFSLQKLAADLEHFKAFWCLFDKYGLLLPSIAGKPPRADELLTRTGERQKDVGNDLYNIYSQYRSDLINTLRKDFAKPLDEAIRLAQKIFDRVIFVAFCEDRGLITEKSIQRANAQIGAFQRIKNPRWQNFLGLFKDIDQGNAATIGVASGYNGGLFADDPAIDNLQLPDLPWTNVFESIAEYDFKDEVNVDVLGHIFERSITELEKKRVAGVFGPATASNAGILPASKRPKMQKSAERKKFGIYYTPPEFTRFIVDQTIGELLRQRFADLETAHGVTPRELADDYKDRSPRLQAYYQQCLHTLRSFKAVDPACGSGAFLIAAYELFADFYYDIAKHLVALGVEDAEKTLDQIPDFILKDNLYGVDLSEEAVEITRLALWIRSARPGKTLADLTHNVVCGNSLVDDPKVHPRAMNWEITFPQVFPVRSSRFSVSSSQSAKHNIASPSGAGAPTGSSPSPSGNWKPETGNSSSSGFDAVIGNPPWERVKLQKREFFAFSAPEMLEESNPALVRKKIDEMETKNPALWSAYNSALAKAEKTLDYLRECCRYPRTSKGDVNFFAVFAELAAQLVSDTGRVGMLLPSGIATDTSTKDFFDHIVSREHLVSLYDFENKAPIFPDVHRAFKFCTFIFGGNKVRIETADFFFFARSFADLKVPNRHIPLTTKDIALLNPSTKTCPIFRNRRDAKITIQLYRRIPTLIDSTREAGGNPWGIRFRTMFHQSGDAEKFKYPNDIQSLGFKLKSNVWKKNANAYLPVYEAKMTQAYDHRAASVEIVPGNWARQAQPIETSLVEHQNPEFSPMPRWWVGEEEVLEEFEKTWGFIGFKDVTSPTNERTMIAAAIPWSGVTHHFPLIFASTSIQLQLCLLANLNGFIYDYIIRQKLGGTTFGFYHLEQLPTLLPDTYADKCPWLKKQTLEQWISHRVLKLSCTANDMIPLAKACNFNPKGDKTAGGVPYVWKWKEQERADLRAQLDAAFFLLYGITDRNDALYILSTFQAAGNPADPHSTASLILSYYDQYTNP